MDDLCGECHHAKPVSHFYQSGRGWDQSRSVCKVCVHGPSPSGLSLAPLPASFAAGLADVIDQIGRMKGNPNGG
jgi:hypothetical protein